MCLLNCTACVLLRRETHEEEVERSKLETSMLVDAARDEVTQQFQQELGNNRERAITSRLLAQRTQHNPTQLRCPRQDGRVRQLA